MYWLREKRIISAGRVKEGRTMMDIGGSPEGLGQEAGRESARKKRGREEGGRELSWDTKKRAVPTAT